MKYDTYFFNREDAIKEAQKNHRVFASNGLVSATQICYYDGEIFKDAPYNCISVPFDNFIEYFSQTKKRHPTQVFEKEFEKSFQMKMEEVDANIADEIRQLEIKIKNQKPNFKNQKLRLFAHACRETVLIQYLIHNIVEATKSFEIESYLHKQDSDLEGCSRLAYLEEFYKFNPHITISINHINNLHLHDDVYNIVWFQDLMPVLLDKSKIYTRPRDIFFHLIDGYGELMRAKGMKTTYQGFCIDTNIYKIRKSIKRERKIVFIGSSYLQAYISLKYEQKEVLCQMLWEEYKRDGVFSRNKRKEIREKFSIDKMTLGHIINYIERDLSLIEIVAMDLNYKIEVYGEGWGSYKELENIYKGKLNYGEEVSKVYNSSEYGLVVGGYILQQRTLESAASGSIPLVLDSRANQGSENEACFDESLILMKNIYELPSLLKEKRNVNLDCIVKENSYEKFVSKIMNIVESDAN